MPTFEDGRRGPSSALECLDFDLKLRLIMRTLSIGTQKEFCGLLQDLNPQTAYTPNRAYKWITGKAVPRDLSVFDDLAQLLTLRAGGDPVGGEWLRVVTFDAFFAGMTDRFGERVAQDMAPRPSAADAAQDASPSAHPLRTDQPVPGYATGTYLAISPAWSVHRAGEFVLGEMVVSRGPEGRAVLDYREYLGLGDIDCTGPLNRHGRCLQAVVTDGEGEEVFSFVLAVPSAPGIVLCGVMSGIAVHDAEARVLAGRVLGLDIQALRGGSSDDSLGGLRTRLQETGAYCVASPAGVQALLEQVGAVRGSLAAHAAAICSYLNDPAASGLVDVHQATVNDLSGYLLG